MSTPKDLFTAPPGPELKKLLLDSPSVDVLADRTLPEGWRGDEALATAGHATGEMRFAEVGLRGPPGRVHGGRTRCSGPTRSSTASRDTLAGAISPAPCIFALGQP